MNPLGIIANTASIVSACTGAVSNLKQATDMTPKNVNDTKHEPKRFIENVDYQVVVATTDLNIMHGLILTDDNVYLGDYASALIDALVIKPDALEYSGEIKYKFGGMTIRAFTLKYPITDPNDNKTFRLHHLSSDSDHPLYFKDGSKTYHWSFTVKINDAMYDHVYNKGDTVVDNTTPLTCDVVCASDIDPDGMVSSVILTSGDVNVLLDLLVNRQIYGKIVTSEDYTNHTKIDYMIGPSNLWLVRFKDEAMHHKGRRLHFVVGAASDAPKMLMYDGSKFELQYPREHGDLDYMVFLYNEVIDTNAVIEEKPIEDDGWDKVSKSFDKISKALDPLVAFNKAYSELIQGPYKEASITVKTKDGKTHTITFSQGDNVDETH